MEKRITGFGPVGWVASAVFVGILWSHLAGFDWQFFVLESIWRVWDWPGVYWFVVHVMHPLSLTLPIPGFNIVSVLPILIGMRIAPVRLGWWSYALVLATASVTPPLAFWLGPQYLAAMMTGGSWRFILPGLVFGFAVTRIATRSWIVAASWFAILPMTWIDDRILQSTARWGTIPLQTFTGWGFDVTLAWLATAALPGAVSIWWAIRLKQRLFAPGYCRECGYCVDGISGGVCPECGEPLSQADVVPVAEEPAK